VLTFWINALTVPVIWIYIGAYFLYWCLLFVLIRRGEEGATSLHAGLERLGEETGEPTEAFGSHPLKTVALTSTERSLRRFKRSHR